MRLLPDELKVAVQQAIAGYLDAIIFTESDDDKDENGIVNGMGEFDFAPSTINEISAELHAFVFTFQSCLLHAMENSTIGYTWQDVGYDLWLTRNGHGIGFWDRDLGGYYGYNIGQALTGASEIMGAKSAYYDGDIQFIRLENA